MFACKYTVIHVYVCVHCSANMTSAGCAWSSGSVTTLLQAATSSVTATRLSRKWKSKLLRWSQMYVPVMFCVALSLCTMLHSEWDVFI